MAEPVAAALHAALLLADVHEIGAHREDLAVGTVSASREDDVHPSAAAALGVDERELAGKAATARAELRRLLERSGAAVSRDSMQGRTAVIVDDGIRVESAIAAAMHEAEAAGAARTGQEGVAALVLLLAHEVGDRGVVDAVGTEQRSVRLEVVGRHAFHREP